MAKDLYLLNNYNKILIPKNIKYKEISGFSNEIKETLLKKFSRVNND